MSRRQLRAMGIGDPEIRRWVRRRELAVVHPGVYVDHTGALSWHQRAWAAVLLAWPAALAGHSALRAADGPGRAGDNEGPVHVAVDRSRTLVEPPGVRIVRTYGLLHRALWNTGPPRMRYEEAALDLALAATDELAMIAALARGSRWYGAGRSWTASSPSRAEPSSKPASDSGSTPASS